jgi:glycosyltransferase involved in cell wall biosynthesis
LTVRVLVVHNRYSSATPSGENVAVAHEIAWLRRAGVEVDTYEASNDDVLGGSTAVRLRAAAETLWSPTAAAGFGTRLDQVRPDVVHVHNLFPLLTASVPGRAIRSGVPVVWTAHNLRVSCIEGTHFRDGAECRLCHPGWRLPGIRHRCYRGSAGGSALVTGATGAFRRLARTRMTTIAISRTLRSWLIDEAGFEPGRVHVKYNAVAAPAAAATGAAGAPTFVFVGKFASYKGIELLLDAWQRVSHPRARLRFVGDGPLAGTVQAAAATDPRITWTGHVPASEVHRELAGARAVLVPSVWDEPFGLVVAEAFALGRPVITTGRGALAEITGQDSGWIVGTDPAALARAIDEAASSDALVAAKGGAGRARHAELFSPEATTAALIDIYRGALAVTERSGGRSD